MKRKIAWLLLICMFIFMFAACVDPQTTDVSGTEDTNTADDMQNEDSVGSSDTVKFAIVAPLSGSSADWGNEAVNGAKLAEKFINDAGGIQSLGGKKVEMVVTDSTSDTTQVATIMERVLTGDQYVATMGLCTSPLATAAMPVAEKLKVPLFMNGTSIDFMEKGYQYAFRITPGSPEYTEAQVGLLKEFQDKYGMSANKIGVIYENTNWGVSQSEPTKTMVEEAGFTVNVFESYTPNMSDASALVTKLKNAGSEIVFVMSQPADLKLILNTMETVKYDPLVIGGGGAFLFNSLYEELGEKTQGIITVGATNWTNAYLDANAECKAVVDAYESEYGHFMNDHAVQTFVQIMLVVEALENTGKADGESVRNSLINDTFTNVYTRMIQPGVDIKFAENGDLLPYALMLQWQDGKPYVIYPSDASTKDIIIPEQLVK